MAGEAELPDRAAAAAVLDDGVVVGLDVDHQLGRARTQGREEECTDVSPLPGTVRGRWSRASLSSIRCTSSTALGARAGEANPSELGHAVVDDGVLPVACYHLCPCGGQGLAAGSKERAGDVEPVLTRREAQAHGRADRSAEQSAAYRDGPSPRATARCSPLRRTERASGIGNRVPPTPTGKQDVPGKGGASNRIGTAGRSASA